MQDFEKQRLTSSLMAICRQAASRSIDDSSLREIIAKTIDHVLSGQTSSESRRVTILLSDLRGFTSISEKYSAEIMVDVLNRYFERMSGIILKHNGVIDKFMGDAIMVLFGAPDTHDNDLEEALCCAIEMQGAMKDINTENDMLGMSPLHMGIGINTGEVVAGNLGSPLHSEYTVIGDQVNLASRVEAHSLRGQILLSENTFQLAKNFVEVGEVNEVHVKGKKDVVRMYELLAVTKPQRLEAPKREIRNSPRVEVDLPMSFQILDGKSVRPELFEGQIIDISYGGMFIVSPIKLEAFSDIKFTLSLSLLSQQKAEIYAKVLRVVELPTRIECRIEFTNIDSTAQRAIKDFVDGIVEIK